MIYSDQSVSDRPILIIDGSNAFVRAYCAYPSVSSHGYQLGGFVGFIKTMLKLVNEYLPSAIIVVWEGGGSSRRRSLYADYKMNRRPEKLNRFYADDIPDSDENRVHQNIALVKALRCLPIWQLYADHAEGDDLIAYLVCGPLKQNKIIIASSDKDMHQLLSNNVTQYSFHKKRVLTQQDVYEEYGILAENFGIAKAICGDGSDNIKGVPRIGFKTLTHKIPILRQRSVILDDVISYAFSHRDICHACQKISDAQELIKLNWNLVKLDVSSFPAAQINQILSSLQMERQSINISDLNSLLLQEGTSSINIDDIIITFSRYVGCKVL